VCVAMRVRVPMVVGMVVMTMVVMLVRTMLVGFHRVRRPLVLESLHAPQSWEENARP
jgi:hypothetical protein